MDANHQPTPKTEAWFVDHCRAVGLRATHQRREIFRELARNTEHPDVETIYRRVKRRVPSISLDTVYRNLRTLEQHGVIQKVGATGYRTRFDANTDPHHHFVCTQCGMIQDFYDSHLDLFQPPANAEISGDVHSVYVELRGRCRACKAAQTGRS